MPRTKPAVLRRITADIQTAELRGQRLARQHPYPVARWLNSTQADKQTPLTPREHDAKGRLLPATWAANLERGWRSQLHLFDVRYGPEAS